MPGLPGTGLAGVFYALLILWMGARELWFTLRGAGDGRRWAAFARFSALLAGILAALWGAGWLLRFWPSPSPAPGLPDRQQIAGEAGTAQAAAMEALIPAIAFTPFLVLAALLLAIQIVRIALVPKVPVAAPARELDFQRRADAMNPAEQVSRVAAE